MTVASLGSQGTQVEASDVYVMQFMLNSITANGTIHTYIYIYIHAYRQQTPRCLCESVRLWYSHRDNSLFVRCEVPTEPQLRIQGFEGLTTCFFGKLLQTFRRIVLASASTKIGSRRLGLFDSESQCITIWRNVGKWSGRCYAVSPQGPEFTFIQWRLQ
jgi:hypothetical protein